MLTIREENNMPGGVVGKDLTLGFVGKISRNHFNMVVANFVKSILNGSQQETLKVINFGDPVVLNVDNSVSKMGDEGAGVSAATFVNFLGFAVAEVKQTVTYGNVSGSDGYCGGQPADILAVGSIMVKCVEGTPAIGTGVYVCTVAATTGGTALVGDILAIAVPAGTGAPATIQLTNVKWSTGKMDTNRSAEVTILTQNNP
jgi:hypothetical protein